MCSKKLIEVFKKYKKRKIYIMVEVAFTALFIYFCNDLMEI